MSPFPRRALLLLFVLSAALITSGTASAACIARPLVLLHASTGAGRTTVKLPAFLRATLICGEARGPRGWRGFRGTRGVAGLVGVAGPIGATGATGTPGANGATGAQGQPGAAGTNGTNGSQGLRGDAGTNGTNGISVTPDYAYVYDTSGQTVAADASVLFSTNGLKTSSITHVAGTSDVVLATSGIYKVTILVLGNIPFEVAVFQNGLAVPGGTYAGDGTNRGAGGQAIVTVTAGDVLTLRNHGTNASITLDTGNAGTFANVDASILIERLA